MDEKTKEEEMENILGRIEPTQEDFVNRRINHIPFAKLIFWLNYTSLKQDFVYASELSKYMKVAQSRAYNILRDLCKAEMMYKREVGNLVEFHFCKNGGEVIVKKYLERAQKTLDLP